MTEEQQAKAEVIIDRQITMSGQTLDALRKAGLKDEMELQLDFFFAAPNEKAGHSLVAHLGSNDCLDVSLEKSGGFLTRKFTVRGKTHPTQVNVQVLAQWIPWIVVQGITYGCEFDGWGTEV